MNWYLKAIRDNYANFDGRARRTEFWMFYLFHIIIIFVLAFLAGLISGSSDSFMGFIPLAIYFLATIIPFIALAVRRLHDTGKSGWYYLLSFIPYVGGNEYGPDPKNPELDNEIDDIGKPEIEA